VFGTIRDTPGNAITLVDHPMSGLALFGLKDPSPLQFEHDYREETTLANLKALYGVERAPSDTRFRERLDALDPSQLRPLYKALFAELQHGKGLEGFATSMTIPGSRSTARATSLRRRSTARSAPRNINATAPPPNTARCSARCWCPVCQPASIQSHLRCSVFPEPAECRRRSSRPA
jgi:hypothetical protein